MLDHKTTVLSVLAGADSVSAHGYIAEVNIDGVAHVGFNPAAAPYGPKPDSISWANGATDLGFVPSSSAQEADVICHPDAVNGILTAPVAVGSTIELTWTEWPDSHKRGRSHRRASWNRSCIHQRTLASSTTWRNGDSGEF